MNAAGSWTLQRLIHVGKLATVYRATSQTGVSGALKRLLPSAVGEAGGAERFALEIAALAKLQHPAVPRLLDQGLDEEGLPWFVTEWFSGWDLETHRQRLGGMLPASEVVDLGARLLQALGHAHARGFIHRDVKPANLFLTEASELKVLDFGICRALSLAHCQGITGDRLIGSPGFMAPEQASRQRQELDSRADIWAAGATLFVLASGRPVHEGDAEAQRRAAFRSDARSLATVVEGLPRGLVEVVDRALARHPDERFQRAEDMCVALQACNLGGGLLVHDSPPEIRQPLRVSSALRNATELDDEFAPSACAPHEAVLRLVCSPDGEALREQRLCRDSELLVGRDAGALGWTLADQRMSRVHVALGWDAQQLAFRVTDIQSTNGFRVNGERRATCLLRHGDVLRAGNSVFVMLEREPMAEVRRVIARAAPSLATVLLVGETGVGKDVICRQIHDESGRNGAFVAINCGALSRELAGSELFGHVKGAFSGSAGARRGAFQAAQGGTLLLDEIGELPEQLQPLLLRALQTCTVRPVGSDVEQPVDLRVLAATNVNVEEAVASGTFRADLFARLAQVVVRVPPLRERKEEIVPLVQEFLARHGHPIELAPGAVETLLLYDWPFNVRELENIIRRLAAVSPPATPLTVEFLSSVDPEMTRWTLSAQPSVAPGAEARPRSGVSNRKELESLLRECAGNVSEVARRLDTNRAQVYRWLERFGLDPSRLRESE
jgi:transcriptional regulator with AAA-type ATPase domain